MSERDGEGESDGEIGGQRQFTVNSVSISAKAPLFFSPWTRTLKPEISHILSFVASQSWTKKKNLSNSCKLKSSLTRWCVGCVSALWYHWWVWLQRSGWIFNFFWFGWVESKSDKVDYFFIIERILMWKLILMWKSSLAYYIIYSWMPPDFKSNSGATALIPYFFK